MVFLTESESTQQYALISFVTDNPDNVTLDDKQKIENTTMYVMRSAEKPFWSPHNRQHDAGFFVRTSGPMKQHEVPFCKIVGKLLEMQYPFNLENVHYKIIGYMFFEKAFTKGQFIIFQKRVNLPETSLNDAGDPFYSIPSALQAKLSTSTFITHCKAKELAKELRDRARRRQETASSSTTSSPHGT